MRPTTPSRRWFGDLPTREAAAHNLARTQALTDVRLDLISFGTARCAHDESHVRHCV